MRIPKRKDGEEPCLHTQHLRTYGAGGFRLTMQEEMRGCPALYRAKYVDYRVPAGEERWQLSYGTAIHRALYLMEERAIGPEEALEQAWPADLPIELWKEAKADLNRYLERGGPMNRFGTIAVEQHLEALLYEDDEYGPVFFGGTIDWMGIDTEEPWVLHVVDYKTNRFPPSREDVKGDVQLMGYDWLVRQHWERYMGDAFQPQVVVHLDAIKYRDVEWRFGEVDLEDWQAWASAIARRILRDEEADPKLNPGCSWCPIKLDCKAFRKLPGLGTTVAEKRAVTRIEQLWEWRCEAAATKKALDAGIEEVDAMLKGKAEADGEFVIGDRRWYVDVDWKKEWDLQKLQALLGDRFYDVISVGIGKLDALKESLDPELADAVEHCVTKEPTGKRVKNEKVKS